MFDKHKKCRQVIRLTAFLSERNEGLINQISSSMKLRRTQTGARLSQHSWLQLSVLRI